MSLQTCLIKYIFKKLYFYTIDIQFFINENIFKYFFSR